MERISTTPFGQRPVTATLMKRATEAQRPAAVPHIDKWALFRDICTARHAYGVTDRDLTVLNALMSFHQNNALSDNDSLIVFPSNRKLSERAHGMAESTLRRHLAALVNAGLIHRHDSPNGKRYAARGVDGDIARAFGFDLRPLLVRAREITRAAAEATAAADRCRRLREEVMVMKRDAMKLCDYGQDAGIVADWDAVSAQLLNLHKAARRKLPIADLEAMKQTLKQVLSTIHASLDTNKMDGSDIQIERHHQNSNKDSPVSEPCLEKQKASPVPKAPPNLPLAVVLKACPDIAPYTSTPITQWHQLVQVAGFVRGMMGISPDAWTSAQRDMGPEVAAVTVAAMLQRVDEIKSPGGYLRSLACKAADGAFSPGPMVMALLR